MSSTDEKELFLAAAERPPAERQAFVLANAHDRDHADAVIELLAAHERASSTGVIGGGAPGKNTIISDPTLGEIHLETVIGAGGLGIVYRGKTPDGVVVAVKILPRHLVASATAREAFHRECRVARKLSHPSIIRMLAAGESGGTPYLVTEYAASGTLAERVKPGAESPSPADRLPNALGWICQIGNALDHAHSHNVLHRDLKPQNVLFMEDGNLKLADFGIAKILDATESTVTLAHAGSCQFMSPERFRPDHSPDVKDDVFGLGGLLFFMLAGTPPVEGTSREEVVKAAARGKYLKLGEISPWCPTEVRLLCEAAMHADARARYQSVAEFLDNLRRVQGGSHPRARLARTSVAAAHRQITRRQAIVGIAGGALATVGVVYAVARALDDTPIVRIAGIASGALVRAARFTNASRFHGSFGTPKVIQRGPGSFRLDPGYWRISVMHDGRIAEYQRVLKPGDDLQLEGDHAPADQLNNMVKVTLDEELLRTAPEEFRRDVADVVPFWIDASEVCNGDYERFVKATRHRAPPIWDRPRPDNWALLPVVSVTRDDAAAFAEWCGKRLPLFQEWQLAARTSAGLLLPWSRHAASSRVDILNRSAAGEKTNLAWVTYANDTKFEVRYEDRVRPVNADFGEDMTGGLFHMLGNVSEWTDSLPPLFDTPGGKPRSDSRLIAGFAWGDGREEIPDLSVFSEDLCESRFLSRGFRCARSASSPG